MFFIPVKVNGAELPKNTCGCFALSSFATILIYHICGAASKIGGLVHHHVQLMKPTKFECTTPNVHTTTDQNTTTNGHTTPNVCTTPPTPPHPEYGTETHCQLNWFNLSIGLQ